MNKTTEELNSETASADDKSSMRLLKLASITCKSKLAFVLNEHGKPSVLYSLQAGIHQQAENIEQLAQVILKNKLPLEIIDPKAHPNFNAHASFLEEYKIADFVILTISSSLGRYKGSLCIARHKPGNLNKTQKEALQLISEQLSVSIDEGVKSSRPGIKRLLEKKFASLSYYYNAFLNGTDYGVILMDTKGLIQVFNAGAEKMLQWSADEIINKKNIYFFHEPDELASHFKMEKNNPYPFFTDYVYQPLNGQTSVNTWTFIKKDAEKITVQLSVSAIRNEQKEIIGYLGVADDVTEKTRTRQELQLSEERHRFFFENTQGLMCSHDNEGKLLTINTAGATLLGYMPEELTGKAIEKLVPEILKPRLEDYFKTITQKGFAAGLVKLKHKDGTVRVLFYKNVRIGSGNKSYVIGNAIDVSSRIEMENDLKKAKLFAERANQAKDQFLANMSHEIRTPMNAIIGFADVLAESNLDSEQEECVGAIRSAGENLLGIINDILDYSKIQSGKLSIESIPFNLVDTIQNTCNILKLKAAEKNLSLHLLLDQSLPQELIGDRLRINQILMNLIGNAIKFTEAGEVLVSLKTLAVTENTCTIKFSVKDTGIGIPAEKIENIFDRFTQASNETTRKYGGTGLGLSISRNLIEIQGGKLDVVSKEGYGSEFSFVLRFNRVEVGQINQQKTLSNSNQLPGHIKVLLIEDNELNQKLARRVLKGFGFEVEIAENGKQGVDKLRTGSYDVVLMDLQMPVMDGYQAAVEIRQTISTSVPIIAMTAHSLAGEKEKCLKIGMNDYIAKPFKADDLFYKITLHAGKPLEKLNPVPTKIHLSENSLSEFSLVRLNELSGGDDLFVKEMLSVFITNTPAEIAVIDAAIAAKNYALAKLTCHKLKSGILIFNANELAKTLAELEYATRLDEQFNERWLTARLAIEQMVAAMKETLIKNY